MRLVVAFLSVWWLSFSALVVPAGGRPQRHQSSFPILSSGSSAYQLATHKAPPSSFMSKEDKSLNSHRGRIVFTTSDSPLPPSAASATCAVDRECSGAADQSYRSPDGSCNNLEHPSIGQSGLPFVRLVERKQNLADHCGKFSAPELPNPRALSRLMIKRSDDKTMPDKSMMVMVWGQIIDHDIELTPLRVTPEGEFLDCCAPQNELAPDCCAIWAPMNDLFYGKEGRPRCIPFIRSLLSKSHGPQCSVQAPDVANANTPWVDASFVYGSDAETVNKLRASDGSGKLRTSVDKRGRHFPPLSVSKDGGVVMEFGDSRGDVHTIATIVSSAFVRNHNRLAEALAEKHPNWDEETLYQEARKINAAIVQHITYTDFLDLLLGVPNNAVVPPEKRGKHNDYYDSSIDASISMGFGTAGYRLHTYVSGSFDLRDAFYRKHQTMRLRDMFHNVTKALIGDNYDDFVRGTCAQKLMDFDNEFTSEMTEWLFMETGKNWGLDIAALNIQRGRDHQIPGYPTYKKLCQLGDSANWEGMTDLIEPSLVHRLVHSYKRPEDVDLYVAGNMESPLEGTLMGPTFHCLVREQFERLRDADRFFYTNPDQFTEDQLATISKQTLARVLCDNADDPGKMALPKNVFKGISQENPIVSCSDLSHHPPLDIAAWA